MLIGCPHSQQMASSGSLSRRARSLATVFFQRQSACCLGIVCPFFWAWLKPRAPGVVPGLGLAVSYWVGAFAFAWPVSEYFFEVVAG